MEKSVRSFIPVLLTLVLLSACKQNNNQKQSSSEEDSLLGEWYTIKGDVEAYSFLKDDSSYIFTGTQGMRPVVYGNWKIENDRFIIKMDNGTTTEYTYVLKNDTLTLNNGAEIFTRTEPLEIKHPELSILLNIASDFSSLDFSAPGPADIKWAYYVDSLQTFKEFTIQGFSITGATVLPSDEISDLNTYIRDYGFESDTLLVTEICNGFWDADHIVTLCTSQDPEAENDSVFINISSGIVIK